MKHSLLAAILVLSLGLAAFSGVAVAGNGHGTGNAGAHGNGSGGAPPATSAAPAAPGNSANAPGQAEKPDGQTQQSSSRHESSGPTKHAASTASTSSGTQPGVKPSSTTDKWTKCGTVGGSGTSTSCARVSPANASLDNVQDTSKRYGNGQTAAQIASSRGASTAGGVYLTGPGNSQPHKVSVCGKPSNKSGGVDVHAVKSYDESQCTSTQSTETEQQTQVQAPCGFTGLTLSTLLGVMHVNGKGEAVQLMTNTRSAHFSKHAEDVPTAQTSSVLVPNGVACAPMSTPASYTVTPAVVPPGVSAAAGTSGGVSAPAPSSGGAPTASPAGGVLGAQASLATQRPSTGGHGVLGAVARVGGTLPFTGFPLWIAALVALALITAGLLLRRRGRAGARI